MVCVTSRTTTKTRCQDERSGVIHYKISDAGLRTVVGRMICGAMVVLQCVNRNVCWCLFVELKSKMHLRRLR